MSLALALAALAGCGGSDGGGSSSEPASFDEVQQIVEQRCVPCHSDKPKVKGYEQAGLPNFSIPENIKANREAIYQVVVVEKRMPFNNNQTGMTQEERDRIGSWAKSATS